MEGGADGRRAGLERREHAGPPLGGDEGYPRLDDPRLLARDLFERVPQVLLVVQRHVGDRGDRRRDHVGRVEAPAESHLDAGALHPLLGEDVQREEGGRLEERHTQAIREGTQPGGGGGKARGRDGAAVDHDAFPEGAEVG